jgi:hypothetical protein
MNGPAPLAEAAGTGQRLMRMAGVGAGVVDPSGLLGGGGLADGVLLIRRGVSPDTTLLSTLAAEAGSDVSMAAEETPMTARRRGHEDEAIDSRCLASPNPCAHPFHEGRRAENNRRRRKLNCNRSNMELLMNIVRSFTQCMAAMVIVGALMTAAAHAKGPKPSKPSPAVPSSEVVDRLKVPGPIVFNTENYILAWSSHLEGAWYKQEYVPAGESVERFSSMLMVDLRPDGADATQMAQGIAAQIDARSGGDPIAHFDMIVNPEAKEAIIDFLISAKGEDGEQIVEWSAHRYTTRPDGTGTVLVGIARRGYGEATINFLKSLKTTRQRDIEVLSTLKVAVAEPK